MGAGAHYEPKKVKLTRWQRNQIEPISIGGEWIKTIDPVTGAIKWIRKKIKVKK